MRKKYAHPGNFADLAGCVSQNLDNFRGDPISHTNFLKNPNNLSKKYMICHFGIDSSDGQVIKS